MKAPQSGPAAARRRVVDALTRPVAPSIQTVGSTAATGATLTTRQRELLVLIEQAYFFLVLLVLTDSLKFLFSDVQSSGQYTVAGAQEGNRLFQMALAVCFLVSMVWLAVDWRRAWYLISKNGLLFLFLGFVLASIAWADEPGLAMRRGIALFGTTMLGLHIVVRRTPEEFLDLLVAVMIAAIVINLFFIGAMPAVGTDLGRDGAFQGILGHKNDFGRLMVMAAIVFWVARKRMPLPGMASVLLLLALALAFLSASRSAWLVAAAVFGAGVPLAMILENRQVAPTARIVGVVGGVLAGIVIGMEAWPHVLAAIGKDATLTDRTIIWAIVIEQGWQRPLMGHGYGSFWEGPAGATVALLWTALGHSHNGFIDVWLELGFAGLATFVAVLATVLRRSIRGVVLQRDALSHFALLFILAVTVYNIVARAAPDHSTIIWAIMSCVLAYGSMAQDAQARPEARRAPAAPGTLATS